MPAETAAMVYTIGQHTKVHVVSESSGVLELHIGQFDKTIIIQGRPDDLARLTVEAQAQVLLAAARQRRAG